MQPTGIIIGTIIIMILIMGVAVYFKIKEKQQKEGGVKIKDSSSASNTNSSKVKDSRDLVKEVEDIRDGIIITDNATRFICAITCKGVSDFYDQSAAEQMGVMKGYLGFVNTITGPMTYRLYSRELDMDYTIEKYTEKRDEYIQRYKFLDNAKAGIPKEEVLEHARIEEEMNNLRFRIEHLTAQMQAVDFYSSSAVAVEQVQDYIFEWKYRSADFNKDLTLAERFVRAKTELEVMASGKIAALSSAGVKARLCTDVEVIDAFRRVTQPISVERFRMKEVENSSFFDDIMTSDSMQRMERVVADEAAEDGLNFIDELIMEGMAKKLERERSEQGNEEK